MQTTIMKMDIIKLHEVKKSKVQSLPETMYIF